MIHSTLKTYTCQSCGKTFDSDRKKKYCQPRCNRKSHRPTKVNCEVCGTQVHNNTGKGRNRQYCSPACAAKGVRSKRIGYYRKAARKRSQSLKGVKYKTSLGPVLVRCKYCGCGILRKDSRECYCSHLCRTYGQYEARNCGDMPPIRCAGNGCDVRLRIEDEIEYCKRCRPKCKPRSKRESGRCDECGRYYLKNGSHQRFCSKVCSGVYRRRVSRERARKRLGIELEMKTCFECGEEYEAAGRTRKFCSRLCLKRSTNRLKGDTVYRRLKPQAKSELVKAHLVRDRDNHHCCMCGDAVRYDVGYYHDKSPELDHIVPLALGGDHTYENVMLLCRSCNAFKSDGYWSFWRMREHPLSPRQKLQGKGET